jgi:catalase
MKVAVIVADGFDEAAVSALVKNLAAHKAEAKVVGAHLGTIAANKGQGLRADFSLETATSVLFDAVFVPGGEASVLKLQMEPNALRFIAEAFRHCKAVGLAGEARQLLEGSGLLRVLSKDLHGKSLEAGQAMNLDGLLLGADGAALSKTFVEAMHSYRFWVREEKPQPPV